MMVRSRSGWTRAPLPLRPDGRRTGVVRFLGSRTTSGAILRQRGPLWASRSILRNTTMTMSGLTATPDLLSVESGIALLTLTAMEIVLGIDNIVFISILTGKLPEEQRGKARVLGLAVAMVSR